MKIVVLASGGIDSSCIAAVAVDEGLEVVPVFIDYGQRAANREWAACQAVYASLDTQAPRRIDLSAFGQHVESGLTSASLDIVADAFLPGRNALLCVTGAAVARSVGASRVAIGLLHEATSLFPDQTQNFVEEMDRFVQSFVAPEVCVTAPLGQLDKSDVLKLADGLGITGTYSCHSGNEAPCGECISCLEVDSAKEE